MGTMLYQTERLRLTIGLVIIKMSCNTNTMAYFELSTTLRCHR